MCVCCSKLMPLRGGGVTVAVKVADGQGADFIRNSVIAFPLSPSPPRKTLMLSVYGEAECGKHSDQLNLATVLSVTTHRGPGAVVRAATAASRRLKRAESSV